MAPKYDSTRKRRYNFCVTIRENLSQTLKIYRPANLLHSVPREGPGSSVGWLTTGWTVLGSNAGGVRFTAVQIGPGVHPASCTMGNGSFPEVESGRGVTLTPHHLLMPRSKKRLELYIYSP
jgi:hypothetical protein